jgi:hypothetical protein
LQVWHRYCYQFADWGFSVPQFVTKTPPGTVFHSGAVHFRGQRPIPTISGAIITMLDERFARLRTHRNNIARYRRLINTNLTDLERQFIERRLSEEHSEFELLSAGTFPVAIRIARD